MTPPNLQWVDARSYCFSLGGDLALFASQIDFASVLQSLDSSIPPLTDASVAIPTWFKWYSWNGEQRTPQHFQQNTDGFQCNVYNYQNEIGLNLFSRCNFGRRTKKVRGLCVLPPILPSDNFEYETETAKCPAKCISGYNEEFCWEKTAIDTEAIKNCPDSFNGEARWKCGINGQWMTPSPNLRYRIFRSPRVGYSVIVNSYNITVFFCPSGLSNCTNPLVGTSINNTNEALNNNADPSLSLISLSEAIKETEIASGNIAQLDETVKLAIAKQRELLNSTDATESQDQSSHNFTYSILGLKDILLDNNKAFWGLDSITREEAVDHVQNNIDETLFLLAQNLIEGSNYSNGDFPNLGTSKCILIF